MPPNLNNNNNNTSTGIDEYQYFAPNDPNNPQNQSTTPPLPPLPPISTANSANIPPTSLATQQLPQIPLPQNGLNSATQIMPNNNNPMTSIPMTSIPHTSQIQPDVLLNLTPSTLAALQKLNSTGNTTFSSQPSRPISRARSLTIRSCSSSPSIYIKDEPDSLDDTISLATTSNGKIKLTHKSLARPKDNSTRPLQNSKNLNNSTQNLVIDERDCSDLDDDPDDDVDMLDDRLSISTSLQSLNKVTAPATSNQNNRNPHHHNLQPTHQLFSKPTAREILYTKFGEFLAARLNTLNENVANELMNKILMLIAEK